MASDFSNLNVYMNLYDKETNQLIAIDKSYMLDDVEFSDDHLGQQSDLSVARNHDSWDHLQSIEVSGLAKGKYRLTIDIPKGHWFAHHEITTCLSFDLMIEFVAKGASWTPEDDFTDATKSGVVNIMSIFPPDRDSMRLGSELHMLVHLDRPIDIRQAAERLPDLSHLC